MRTILFNLPSFLPEYQKHIVDYYSENVIIILDNFDCLKSWYLGSPVYFRSSVFTLLIFDVQQTHKIKVQGHILCIELLWHFSSWHFYLKSDIWVICLFQIFTARLLWSYLSWRISGTRGKFDISELCILFTPIDE